MQIWLALATQVAVIAGIWVQWIEIGSELGNWTYPYTAVPKPWDVLGALALCALLFAGWRRFSRWMDGNERGGWHVDVMIVGGTLFVGMLIEVWMRSRYQFSVADVLGSNRANGFFMAASKVDINQLLRHFQETVANFPPHVRTNMPGKVIFCRSLLLLTQDPAALGWLVIAVSNLSAIAVYAIGKELFHDRVIAQSAMLLSIVTPAKIAFQPILNTVSPVLILFALLMGILSVTRNRPSLGLLGGVLLYLQFIFEPLPFALGIVFLALIIGSAVYADAKRRSLVSTGYLFTGFAGSMILMFLVWGFDTVEAFRYVLLDAANFNVVRGRYYDIWIAQNLKEYFIGAGAASSVFVIASIPEVTSASWRRREVGVGALLVTAFLVTVLILDLIGLNRGEVTRLWIFLTPIQALATAYACARWFQRDSYAVALSAALMQAAVCIGSVGYVLI